jgi:hypothetical protein
MHADDGRKRRENGITADLRRTLRESLEGLHHDVLRCAARLGDGRDRPDPAADLAAAVLIVDGMAARELEPVLVRTVAGIEADVHALADRVVLARALLDRMSEADRMPGADRAG